MGSFRTIALLTILAASGPPEAGLESDNPKPAEPPVVTIQPQPSAAPASQAPASNGPGTSPAPAAVETEPPAPPRQYLETGAKLYNKGKLDLASKYLQAAQMYRDKLSDSERIVLDVYREKLEQFRRSVVQPSVPPSATAMPAPVFTGIKPEPSRSDDGVTPASTTGTLSTPGRAVAPGDPVQALSRRPDEFEASVFGALPELGPPPGPAGADPARGNPPGAPTAPADPSAAMLGPKLVQVPAPAGPLAGTGMVRGSSSWRDTTDVKQKGRWLLELAREQIRKNHFDIAEQAIAECRALDVKWTVFDETPERMMEALEKARAKFVESGGSRMGVLPDVPGAPQTRDRRTARARLKEARGALAGNDLEKAEQIAREVRSWGVSFGLFDDTPEKVESAVFEARRREAVHNAELMVRSYYRDRGKERTTPEPELPRNLPPAGEGSPSELPAPALPPAAPR